MARRPTRELTHVRAFRALLLGHAHVTEQARKAVKDTCGLTMSEFDMIAELGNQPALRMGELATKMITSSANVTRVAQALEHKGLVERTRAPHSDREVIAQLTEKGDAFFKAHFPAMVEMLGGIFAAALTRAEQEQLAALLEKLARPR